MEDRLIQFLKDQNLTASQLADNIGVQRSSVSHIISGRNKPSFDFIQKLLLGFPKVNIFWLITGKEPDTESKPLQETLFNSTDQLTPLESNISERTNTDSLKAESESNIRDTFPSKEPVNTEKKVIEKIVILYSDKSFKEYTPEM